ncbi:uncharacterized protein LOC133715139 [Rosa rugosa]|uniref:uncharacterized protein LOC133715139 n=1 Tax=Rosa rugosa TaxID=74645 RepID=UPI002B415309|nr:uncharacterized protein LOC133715139 [Rosa rugosa]
MLKSVPELEKYDENFLKAISEVLRRESYDVIGSQIITENDELMNKMFLVTRGEVGVTRPGKRNRRLYKVGALYGEELLDWALDVLHTGTASSLPLSAGTASSTKAEVDVLVLYATELEKKMKELAATDSESED